MPKEKIFEALTVSIPNFLYEELKKSLEKENGVKPSPATIADTVNRAVIFYIQNHNGLEKLQEELNDYKTLCKNSLYNLTYLLAKDIAYSFSKETGENITLESLEEKATNVAIKSSSSLLNENAFALNDDKKRQLEEQYYIFKHPPIKDEKVIKDEDDEDNTDDING